LLVKFGVEKLAQVQGFSMTKIGRSRHRAPRIPLGNFCRLEMPLWMRDSLRGFCFLNPRVHHRDTEAQRKLQMVSNFRFSSFERTASVSSFSLSFKSPIPQTCPPGTRYLRRFSVALCLCGE